MRAEPITFVRPVAAIAARRSYTVSRSSAPADLRLDGTEGAAPPASLLDALIDAGPHLLREYPDATSLETELARRVGVSHERVVVTAGADEAIDRACRAVLCAGREAVLTTPTFEMTERYVALTGATTISVPWTDGAFPTNQVCARCNSRTAMVVVTSPNNPTGGVATADDLRRISAVAPQALLLVDLAYVEFANEDLTQAALALPNAVVLRTFSKAHGLAGLRVGWAAGSAEIVEWMRRAGAPYSVSGPSLLLAAASLRDDDASTERFVARVRDERAKLARTLTKLQQRPYPSQANFVLFETRDPEWFRDALAGLGIRVRTFPGRSGLARCVRIACPGSADAFRRLQQAIETILTPEAVLFDMDGVLADVSNSYRSVIVATCRYFSVEVTSSDITTAKRAGDANDDWALSASLLRSRDVHVPLPEVTRVFEWLYQGDSISTGLRERERLLVARPLLERIGARVRLGIVTGRPREDAVRFLRRFGIDDLFDVVVCREHGPLKPDPSPVREACARLGVRRSWFVGDTRDDIAAARAAGAVPLGIVAPGEDADATTNTLVSAGAARVLANVAVLEELLS